MKKKQTVVLGVTSGIAAYKSVELVSLLKKEGLDVVVVMTESATKMVKSVEFEKTSGNKVYTHVFEKGFDYKEVLKNRHVDHIDIADKTSVVVVAPATANVIAKIAHGIADDFLTTMLLATRAAVIICPSMNVHMWENPIVQENIKKLESRGYTMIDPEEGALACGYEGKGRLANVGAIKDEVFRHLKKATSLVGKKIIITAGGTQENIDEVRYIANRSSGKMGIAIAETCSLRGADVLLLRSSTAVKPVHYIHEEIFETADELFSLIKKHIKDYDIVYHTAAVSDFAIKRPFKGKVSSNKKVILQLTPRQKIISQIKRLNPRIKLIAFKAVWGGTQKELIEIAQKKLEESKADTVVVNDVSKKDRGFGADTNEVIIVTKNGKSKKISWRSKREIGQEIIEFTIQL